MSMVTLKECAEINPRPKLSISDDVLVSFLPMAGIDAETGTTSTGEDRPYVSVKKGYTPFINGDSLVAKITPCFENGKIAQAKIRHTVGFGSTEFHVIRANPEKLNARYLHHFLRQPYILTEGQKRMTGSAGQKRVPATFFSELNIFLPSLQQQERISDILDKANALMAKRRETITLVNSLKQSIFLEMFGSIDKHNWSMTTVEMVAKEGKGTMRTGPFGSQLLTSEFVNQGIAVLGIDNAVSNEFKWGEKRFITEEKYTELKRYTVYPGDVLITIMGTCGRCAIVPEDIPVSINTKHLCCITLDQSKCLPSFLHSYFLLHPVSRKYLSQTAKGAIMDGLNMGIIKSMPIPLPPLELQQEYDVLVSTLKKKSDILSASNDLTQELFTSLQHKAFSTGL